MVSNEFGRVDGYTVSENEEMDFPENAFDPRTLPTPSLVCRPDTDGESVPYPSQNTLRPNQRETINNPAWYESAALVTSMSSDKQTDHTMRPVTNLAPIENRRTTQNSPRPHSRPELEMEPSYTSTLFSWAPVEHSATVSNARGNGQPCRTSIEEHSPYGSPHEKYEEYVPNSMYDPTKNLYRHRLYTRGYSNNIGTYNGRLKTFFGWMDGNMPVNKEIMAKAGFYYEGISDEVYCSNCGNMLHQWAEGDDPREEHFNNFGFDCTISF